MSYQFSFSWHLVIEWSFELPWDLKQVEKCHLSHLWRSPSGSQKQLYINWLEARWSLLSRYVALSRDSKLIVKFYLRQSSPGGRDQSSGAWINRQLCCWVALVIKYGVQPIGDCRSFGQKPFGFCPNELLKVLFDILVANMIIRNICFI